MVLLKLKGKAAAAIKHIRAETWPEVRENLAREFGVYTTIEAVIKQIEDLRQGANESFAAYRRRTLEIIDNLHKYEPANRADTAMIRSLRIHFICGLRNNQLKQMAKTRKTYDAD